jgi:hypothetical protein
VTAVNPWKLHPFVHTSSHWNRNIRISEHDWSLTLSSLNCWLRSLCGLQLALWWKQKWHLSWWGCPQASPKDHP